MKRTFAFVLVFVLVISAVPFAFAEPISFTINAETIVMLSALKGFVEPFGISTYPLDLTAKEKKEKSLVKPFTQYCSLYITQKKGIVTSLKIVSSEDDGSSKRIDEIMACFMAGMMMTDFTITTGDAMEYISNMAQTLEPVVINGISYRVISGQPFTSVVALEIQPQ